MRIYTHKSGAVKVTCMCSNCKNNVTDCSTDAGIKHTQQVFQRPQGRQL